MRYLKIFFELLPYIYSAVVTSIIVAKSAMNRYKGGKGNFMEDMRTAMRSYITLVEKAGETFRSSLGDKFGQWKLNEVLKNLKLFALTNNYEFNEEEWIKNINEEISFTKQVNNNMSVNTDSELKENNKNKGVIQR